MDYGYELCVCVCVFACVCLGMCMSKVVELPVKAILYLICLIKRDTNMFISLVRSMFRAFIRFVQFFLRPTNTVGCMKVILLHNNH